MKRKPGWLALAGVVIIVGAVTFILRDTVIATAQIARYSAILAADSNNYGAAFGLGVAYFRTKDYTKSADAYIKASQIDPTAPQAINNLGNAYRRLLRYEDAEKAYFDTINIAPTYITAYTNLVSLYQAWPQDKGDKISEIPKVLERGIIATENNPTLLRAIITHYRSVGDAENADKYQQILES